MRKIKYGRIYEEIATGEIMLIHGRFMGYICIQHKQEHEESAYHAIKENDLTALLNKYWTYIGEL